MLSGTMYGKKTTQGFVALTLYDHSAGHDQRSIVGSRIVDRCPCEPASRALDDEADKVAKHEEDRKGPRGEDGVNPAESCQSLRLKCGQGRVGTYPVALINLLFG